jgi:hypothetical protein
MQPLWQAGQALRAHWNPATAAVKHDAARVQDWHAALGTDGSQEGLAVTVTGSAVYVAGKSGHSVAPWGVRRSCPHSYLGCR